MANWLWQYILNHTWHVYPQTVLLAHTPPDDCLHTLRQAVKPKRDKLHLQDLFANGRRYDIQPSKRGFTMVTNSKLYWRYTESMWTVKRRTRAAALVACTLTEVADDYTRLELRGRFRVGYLLDVVLLPVFMTSIVVFMPWPVWIIAAIVAALFGLSYAYHYYHAAYQANEMAFFIKKVLQDRLVTHLPTLQVENPDILRSRQEFEEAWERFYAAHRD